VTSISAISRVSGSFNLQQAGVRPPPLPQDGRDPMSSVAKALSLSTDDLQARRRGGESLSGIAERQGISHDDLLAAIKAGKPSDAPSVVDDNQAAEQIAARKGRPGPPGGDPRGPRGGAAGLRDESKLQQLGSLLETDADSLRGNSATDVVRKLQRKGVDLAELRNVLDNGDLADYTA